MAGFNLTYSRLVGWLKILLPVTALALLSTMFLVSKTIDPTTSLTYARVNLDELTGEQKISNPKFSSVTEDGAAITFSAASATPVSGQTNRFTADELVAQIETPDGALVDINANNAEIDGSSNSVELSGGVTLLTSTQYEISADGLTTQLDATHVESHGPVKAHGPLGHLTAGQAQIVKQSGQVEAYLLVFKDGVKLVYEPQSEGKVSE